MKPIPLSTNPLVSRKVGSTWIFKIRRGTETSPIDLTGCTPRSAFREGSVDGSLILLMDGASGLSIPNPPDGYTWYKVNPAQSVLFPTGVKVFFDLEHTDAAGDVWQSPTYWFIPDPEVTR